MVERKYKGFSDPSRVISVGEAGGLVGRKDVVFVDTRNYWRYVDGHVPGAVNLELYAFHWVDTSRAGLEAFAREMGRLFGAFGIDGKKRVVFYEDKSGYDAARGVWLLEWLGGRAGQMLDGGLNAWKRSGLPLSTKDTEFARANFRYRQNGTVITTGEELSVSLGEKGTSVIDSRSRGEFEGSRRRALRTGHVPGAINVEWKTAVRRDGTLKNAAQLRELFRDLPTDSEVVTYCQSGYRAAHSWLILKLLGFKHVKNYIGSWYEWGSSPSTRIEK